MYVLIIGTETADHVAISVRSTDDSSADSRLISDVNISVGAWLGKFEAWFCTRDFPRFREQLEALHSTLDGNARFDTLEHQLALEFTVDGRGHITVSGSASDRPRPWSRGTGDGNDLTFSLELDQSYLPAIINQLRAVEAAFPHNDPVV